jgi:hypothetical protein
VIDAQNSDLVRLRAALDEVGDALSAASLDRLLGVEPELALALESVSRLTGAPRHPEFRAEVESIKASLLRCRRLGAALQDVTRISLDPSGSRGYGRGGLAPSPVVERAGTLETRV